jgi:hypothetical protein
VNSFTSRSGSASWHCPRHLDAEHSRRLQIDEKLEHGQLHRYRDGNVNTSFMATEGRRHKSNGRLKPMTIACNRSALREGERRPADNISFLQTAKAHSPRRRPA